MMPTMTAVGYPTADSIRVFLLESERAIGNVRTIPIKLFGRELAEYLILARGKDIKTYTELEWDDAAAALPMVGRKTAEADQLRLAPGSNAGTKAKNAFAFPNFEVNSNSERGAEWVEKWDVL
ncbi:hypothetical protein N7470_003262 [Penicillium chermesinum]|nr:hypothetical protein N7470_003262 [Penicillium chermesinum]